MTSPSEIERAHLHQRLRRRSRLLVRSAEAALALALVATLVSLLAGEPGIEVMWVMFGQHDLPAVVAAARATRESPVVNGAWLASIVALSVALASAALSGVLALVARAASRRHLAALAAGWAAGTTVHR